MHKANQSLKHIGIFTTDKNGNKKSAVEIMDEIVSKWDELTMDQQYDLALDIFE